MDYSYSAIINSLRVHLDKINRAIRGLESLKSPAESIERRGRKAMGQEERKQVAERMKRYWARRRKRTK